MGIGIVLAGHEPEPHYAELGSARGYSGVVDWMKSLPPGKYPAVEAFARDDRYTGTDELMLQLNDAANDHNPPADGTDELVEVLLERIGAGHPGETVATQS